MNYKVTRIGLLNFWYFDDEEFNFFDGKLLLRGGNGSGKSVTMQSFIPLILDGNKMPTRLDPFGTKEKKIEDYLLGPSDGDQKDDAIGYLYMEAYNEEKDKYITIGMGLYARKGRPTDFWGFAIKDGKRIGIDFQLYKNYGAKILMTKKELRANIGTENVFVETTKEYKSLVNDLLFGFNDLDSYDEFINVLLQLRSSKLSKEYNPTKLMSILSSVLQPLTDDDIRPLSDAIEDTNKTREKIDTLNSNLKDLSNLSKTYQNYNEINLYNKAKSVFDCQKRVENMEKEIDDKNKNIININARLQEIDIKISSLEQELIEITTKLSNVDNKDLKDYTEKLNELKIEISKTESTINNIKQKLEKGIERERKYKNDINVMDDKIYCKERDITEIKEDIISLNEDVKIPDISVSINNEEINFDYLEDRVVKYKNKLNQIKIKLEEKENLELSLSRLEEENEVAKQELEQKEIEKKNNIKKLEEEIDNFKDRINEIDKQNKVVTLDVSCKQKIFDLINDYSVENYIKAKEEYQKEIKYYETNTITERSNIENKLENENKELRVLNEELEILKKTEELEFVGEELTKQAEEILNEKNIPFTTLYKVIEFKDNIAEEEKNKLEELLISMNILNAKLVPQKFFKDIKNIKSVFLKKGILKKNNILSYFDVIDNDVISKEEIIDILSSISVDETDKFYINSDKYELDFLVGYPSKKYQSKYIGITKRKEEHERQILAKEKEIQEKEKIINNYQNILNSINDKLDDIYELALMFPSNKLLDEINLNITKIVTSIDLIFERSKKISEEANKINNDIRIKIEEINKIKENISIPLNLVSYKNALVLVDELSKNIITLKNDIETKNTYIEQKISSELSLESVREDIEYQNEELSEKTKILGELSSKKKAIDEILSNPLYQQQIEELKRLTERAKQIPEENNKLREEKGKLENSLENLNKALMDENNCLMKEKIKLELKQDILEKEYNLNYVYQDEKININKILLDLSSRENSDVTRAFENYIMAFNNYKQNLLDYRLITKEIFTNSEELVKKYQEKGLEEKEIVEILNTMNRQDLETTYQGKRLNIYELSECLKAAIEESENYINTQERHLFEDILLKTVGNKIRDRIESSKEWVKKINEIMRQTQIDSNLSFELEWRSKTAFTEEELDTKELVRLFKIDAGQLKSNDSEKLINHFQSQIKKELEFGEKVNDSYSNVIFKVLDYRNWFEFKLFYKRKSGEKKELTNKVFSILSGGERAKSMYVPLFAAVYAKLLNAKESSLRLIALDEAFAGVDNVNIREMFDILSQLNLDYILTSQSLWGDYDTVKELSICELIKDEIHKAVAVRHYRWNGHSKEILEKSGIYE